MSDYTLKTMMNKPERLAPGHRMCAGCGATIAVRAVLRALHEGDQAVIGNATGCLEVSSFMYPYTAWEDSYIHNAFENAGATLSGVETAYKAVMKPKEGTILTVARGMSEKMTELAPKISDIKKLLGLVIEYGDEVLNYTPELLPVPKQAGVVDSGGQGLMQLMKGAYDALMGKKVDYSNVISESKPAAGKETTSAKGIEDVNIEFGYCTEFIVNIEKKYGEKEEAAFKAFLESIGNSIVIVSDDEIVKVHVHTNHPGLAFEEGLKYGSLSKMKVDNMREEHEERLIANASKVAGDNKETEHKEEAEEEIGFEFKDYPVRIEALAMANGEFIVTVTRVVPDSKNLHKKVSVKRKNTKIDSKNPS